MEKYNFIGTSYQFWNLVRESINEMEKINNINIIYSKPDPSTNNEESWINYDHKTRWNDFKIGVPLLFNYYHGLELLMKGLLQETNNLPPKNTHKLSDYYELIKTNQHAYSVKLVDLIGQFITESNPFNDFFLCNGGDVNDFYLMLRYPTKNKDSDEYQFKEIRGRGENGLVKWIQLRENTINIKKEIELWNTARSY